jgi:hypothetical protein
VEATACNHSRSKCPLQLGLQQFDLQDGGLHLQLLLQVKQVLLPGHTSTLQCTAIVNQLGTTHETLTHPSGTKALGCGLARNYGQAAQLMVWPEYYVSPLTPGCNSQHNVYDARCFMTQQRAPVPPTTSVLSRLLPSGLPSHAALPPCPIRYCLLGLFVEHG